MSKRSDALANVLEQGANALIAFASSLTDAEWQVRVPHDGRKVGVTVHHVASVYPIEVHLAQTLADGKPVTGVVWDGIHEMNAGHAKDNDGATRADTIALLRKNSADAAAAVRKLSDEQLDQVHPISLYADAPLSCQFMLEDHAVRHSFHHLAKLRAALKK